jgi:endonuclease III
MAIAPNTSLPAILTRLGAVYRLPEPLTDPFALILWENIGYLIDDDRRRALMSEFHARVGETPAAISAAGFETLLDIARRGGMRPEARVERWREIARLIEACGGDLAGALRDLPLAKARALLKRFPVIGDPGADKVLLFSGVAPRASLDSNGVRVLARLGYFPEQKSYDASYRAAIAVLSAEGVAGFEALRRAYRLLQAHGRALCKRGAPLCLGCSLDTVCAHAPVAAL